ncbi:MAG TPA: glycosyltransferase family 39 protein, partial [Candidatus Dormibacteraeota bacterium]|nr:glycosyltransferase family 39 protein [Candidatus Dormibacteraeota bacterium]
MNPAATRIGPPAARSAGTGEAVLGFTGPRAAWATLASLLLFFFLLESFVPLRTAIQIGGDEGFELAKATLCLKGHSLYTEVWNDQPPLHTLLNTELLRLTGPGKRVMQPENYTRILWPRLLTVAFATLLITAFFLLLKNISGFATASLACAFLIASPGVLGLSASCMLEIPAVSLGMAALYILARAQQSLRPRRSQVLTALAGAVLGLSLLSKLVTITLFPAFGALICVSATHEHGRPRRFDWMVILKTVVLPIGSAIITFLAVDLLIEKGAYLTHFHQSWTSHFAPAVSFEYGSAADHPFPWSVLLKHWDATLPAGVSLAVLLLTTRNQTGRTFLPFFWLGASLLIFGLHQPWWSYYYIHIAVPLAWCAASGLVLLWSFAMRHRALLLAVVLYATLALLWTGSRLYLQIAST